MSVLHIRNEITLEDAIDWFEGDLDEMIQEAVWDGGFNTDAALAMLEELAKVRGFTIVDADDYDSLLQDVYDNTEKGLS